MAYLGVVTVIACLLCHATSLHIQDCMKNGRSDVNNIVHVNSATVTPFPVVVPGNVDVAGNLDVLKNITGPLQMHLSVQRKFLGLWVTVPCVSNVGSCTYDDVCSMLSSSFSLNGAPNCPAQLSNEGLPCNCPFAEGRYTMNQEHFKIPEMSGVWSWLASVSTVVEL
ncbi:Ganglioside GM2 activator [Mizuhopecten yessoensis]|uniref:Ganglioside GM2 activator n=1 Tax=Mizuhopecten yessoensis TaxID=6573 RepID=A0A210QUS1_MIZYE|nr:Ganglioside GM2 activator [Mizuhopecten yessoensis]